MLNYMQEPADAQVIIDLRARLANRTRDVYAAIVNYKTVHCGDSPTIRQIAEMVGLASGGAVNYQLHKLANIGLIKLSSRKARGISVVGAKWIAPVELTERKD